MGVLLEDGPEEWRASRQDELVCLNLPGTTAQGAVKSIFFLSDISESHTDIAFKIIPSQTKLFISTLFSFCCQLVSAAL